MSNVVNLRADESITDDAVNWITRIDRGLSDEEKQAFGKWLAASREHQDCFIRYARLWDKMDSLSILSELVPKPEETRKRRLPYGMAACIAVLLMGIIGVWQREAFYHLLMPAAQVIVQQDFQTGVGERATFYMQDKTRVVLNTNSKVKVIYTNKQRLFELLQGEIYIDVAHAADWPLSVHAAEQRIQAVGTAFNVELERNKVSLIVTEGKVRVAPLNNVTLNPLMNEDVRLPTTALQIEKGERINLGAAAQVVTRLSESDINASLSWQIGELVFRGETLSEVLAEVSRYTPYEFEFAHEDAKQIRVSGLFKIDDLTTLLSALEQNFNVRYQRTRQFTIEVSLDTAKE